jgi:hypothetical protein
LRQQSKVKKEIMKIVYWKKLLFRFSNESDSYSAADKDDLTDNREDSNNNLDSLNQLQNFMVKLGSSIKETKETLNSYFK